MIYKNCFSFLSIFLSYFAYFLPSIEAEIDCLLYSNDVLHKNDGTGIASVMEYAMKGMAQ